MTEGNSTNTCIHAFSTLTSIKQRLIIIDILLIGIVGSLLRLCLTPFVEAAVYMRLLARMTGNLDKIGKM